MSLETRPLLTVVIPVYNEADTVERLVERVKAVAGREIIRWRTTPPTEPARS
jgi:hypothetical protein